MKTIIVKPGEIYEWTITPIKKLVITEDEISFITDDLTVTTVDGTINIVGKIDIEEVDIRKASKEAKLKFLKGLLKQDPDNESLKRDYWLVSNFNTSPRTLDFSKPWVSTANTQNQGAE